MSKEEVVSKRVHITLPDAVFEALERWADDQGRPIANLTAYIVEKAVEEAQEDGKIPPHTQEKPKKR